MQLPYEPQQLAGGTLPSTQVKSLDWLDCQGFAVNKVLQLTSESSANVTAMFTCRIIDHGWLLPWPWTKSKTLFSCPSQGGSLLHVYRIVSCVPASMQPFQRL